MLETLTEHTQLLRDSFWRIVGQDLGAEPFYAPFMLVSHNTDADPVFNYGNQMALQLFEMSWDEFTKLPSRYSAAPLDQQERSQLLKIVSEQGYIKHYSGVRISKTGKKFLLKEAIVWNLIDAQGVYRGQAALCDRWEYI